jgi:hypothetical protein
MSHHSPPRRNENKLTAAYAFVFGESVLTITDVDVRLLTPTVAIAHVHWTMTGARNAATLREGVAGYPDADLDKIGRKMVDRSVPKHNRHTRDAISAGAGSFHARTREQCPSPSHLIWLDDFTAVTSLSYIEGLPRPRAKLNRSQDLTPSSYNLLFQPPCELLIGRDAVRQL